MTTPAGTAGVPAPSSDRERIEAVVTRDRIVELQLDPVKGNFDAAHLREVNRRIFQDMPGKGFDDVRPGQYRQQVPSSGDWMKNRGLTTAAGNFFVAYSPMNAASQAKIDEVLKEAKPAKLAALDPEQFTKTLAKVYAELDYIHPFADGNSRTLRTFTKQLANEAGYDLDWERFNRSVGTRDALYVARDKAVNAIALPRMQNERSMARIVGSMDRLKANKNLEQILEGAARPLRAVAFEREPATDAVKKHPELEGAYRTLTAATKFASSLELADQVKFVEQARASIQTTLNAGKLVPEPPMKKKERDQGHER